MILGRYECESVNASEFDACEFTLLVSVSVVEDELAAAADTGAQAVERGNGLLP